MRNNGLRGMLALVLATTMASAAGLAQAAIFTYTAVIDESQEVPPSGAPGVGIGIFTLDDVTGLFTWDVNYVNLTGEAIGAHIHAAPPGANGGVFVNLDSSGTVISSGVGNGQTFGLFQGSFVLAPAQLPLDPFAPDWYINIHTAVHPGGEIRGDLGFAAVVPLPPALILFGSSLLLLARRGRTRRA